jgi:hypothetical protein
VVSGDGKPVGNVNVEVGSGFVRPSATTDGSGQYRMELSSPAGDAYVTAVDERFPFQPCAVPVPAATEANPESTAHVELTTARGQSNVSTRVIPGRRRVSGVVFVDVDTTKGTASEASVAWDASNDDVKAWTETSTGGRFALCGLPIDRPLSIVVNWGLEQAFATVPRGSEDHVLEVYLRTTP